MLLSAFLLLCGAGVFGAALAVLYFRRTETPAAASAAHGALGAVGLSLLLIALGRGLPRTGMGTAGFGPSAAALLALTLALGLRLGWMAWRRRRPSELLVGAHALFAVAGLVLVLSLVALG